MSSKGHRSIIYVVAHTQELVDEAKRVYSASSTFRPVLLPKSPFMESVMYTQYLLDHEEEWKECDYVGCIGYACHKKQPNIMGIDQILNVAKDNKVRLVALLYRGDALLETAARWHTVSFLDAWLTAWNVLGYTDPYDILNDEGITSFYCNYWACPPEDMKTYCEMMKRLSDVVLHDPKIKPIMWRDSTYHTRGTDIAKLTPHQCQSLFGVPYYPMLGFVCERIPCMWFSCLHPNAPVQMMLLK